VRRQQFLRLRSRFLLSFLDLATCQSPRQMLDLTLLQSSRCASQLNFPQNWWGKQKQGWSGTSREIATRSRLTKPKMTLRVWSTNSKIGFVRMKTHPTLRRTREMQSSKNSLSRRTGFTKMVQMKTTPFIRSSIRIWLPSSTVMIGASKSTLREKPLSPVLMRHLMLTLRNSKT